MTKRTLTYLSGTPLMYEGKTSIKFKGINEVHEGALSDSDAKPQTAEELDKFKRTNPFAKKH